MDAYSNGRDANNALYYDKKDNISKYATAAAQWNAVAKAGWAKGDCQKKYGDMRTAGNGLPDPNHNNWNVWLQ